MTGRAQSTPELSVIIPTRNRARSLQRTLAALDRQQFPAARFEVIVVANACTDDTGAVVRGFPARFALRLYEHAARGISLARNSGAALARGRVLVFLDDDIEPVPTALAARAVAHDEWPDLIAVGPLLAPPLPVAAGLLGERLRRLDADHASSLRARASALDWLCMVGGNMSTSTELFHRAGGFDTAIVSYGSEDYEFGFRAQQAGARFMFLAAAGGHHYREENSPFAEYLRRGRSAGRNDVEVVRRHPEALDRLPIGLLTRPQRLSGRLGRCLAFDHPRLGDRLADGLAGAAAVLARMRQRRAWNRLVDRLYQYWYFRGAADRLGTRRAAAEFVESVRQRAGIRPGAAVSARGFPAASARASRGVGS
ncbi:MAG: glycosyltransferase family 2 protein [Deltaproteobacteria bacterium]|nr:glycosyltransferase family 2 protein [Deltaproteobacteria bacterium]